MINKLILGLIISSLILVQTFVGTIEAASAPSTDLSTNQSSHIISILTHSFNDGESTAGFVYSSNNNRITGLWITGTGVEPLTFKIYQSGVLVRQLTGIPANNDSMTIPGQGLQAIEKIDDTDGSTYVWYPSEYTVEVY